MSDQDELQAAEYRRQMQAREDNKALLEQNLMGKPDATLQILSDFNPLRRRVGWDPIRRVITDEK